MQDPEPSPHQTNAMATTDNKMKRKLNESNEPVPAAETTPKTDVTFDEFDLDPRILQAIASQGFKTPTPVQKSAIPILLEGKDVIARARTGSGKTAAYVLPILQAILKRKTTSTSASLAALVLVPTRELADQVTRVIDSLSAFCANEVQTVKLSDKVPDTVARSLLSNSPDIVVATPARAWHNIKNGALSLESITHLVLDEADLVLSFGYDEKDLESIAETLPKGVISTLMSATLTPEVDTLKGIFCRNPTTLDLAEAEDEGDRLTQFVVKCGEADKFLLIHVMFKLQLIKGKTLIFTSDVDRCYRLKLFFEQFGIRSAILNSELPVNSRLHVVSEFNRNVYDIIIASDENEALGDEAAPEQHEEGVAQDDENAEKTSSSIDADKAPPKKKRKSSKRDKEYGVSRGIDFKNVSAVINFDLPTSARSYTHRIGRTARASNSGMALSFVIPKEQYRKHPPTSIDTAEHDEKILARIVKQQAKKGAEVKPYNFDMKLVHAFSYRNNDALRAVTTVAIREARVRELRQELVKSEKLQRHFQENPQELSHLVRHDTELRAARTQAHLKHVPDYLLPAEGKKALTSNDIGFVPFKKNRDGKGRKGKSFKGRGRKVGGRKVDPLKSFRGRPKSK
ncbi:ATP-dependent RNA helicase dbp9 [Xylariales sp. AK1849]|nr:ATP-dependent RNA helicase dbp9 [Xylariales sp. AK1849]